MDPITQYKQRRQQLQNQLKPKSVVLIMARSEVIRNGDAHYMYRPDSNFFYLTGFTEPEAVLLILSKDLGGKSILFNRPRDPSLERWLGFMLGQEGATDQLALDEAYPIEEFSQKLPEYLQQAKHIYAPWGRQIELDEIIDKAQGDLKKRVRHGASWPTEFIDVQCMVDEMRVIKSDYEIELMRYAAKTSVKAHQAVMKYAKPGVHEYQVEAHFMYHCGLEKCRLQAYTPIVAGGANACTLHYEKNDEKLRDGDLLLIDAGAEYQQYSSDLTRTFPINGRFSEPQKLIYELVLKAQLAGIAVIKPSVTWDRVQKVMVDILTRGLVELGLLKGDIATLIEKKAYLQFYMHGSGHFLGLDTHDAGAYKINGEWRVFEAGMVLTVEPGLYIDATDMSVAEKWRGIGVRIEDDVVVTREGCDVLSKELIKTVADIEAWMAQ